MRSFSSAAWPTSPSPSLKRLFTPLRSRIGVARQQLAAPAPSARAVHDIEDALLRGDDRRQLGENQPADRQQIFLALQHAGELRQVRLQPVLLVVAQRRVLQVANHLVDVVLHERDLALRIDLNRPRQIALRHRRRDVGNRAQLRGQIAGELIHVVGQIAPRAGRAGHVGLAAEFSFHAHFARHAS